MFDHPGLWLPFLALALDLALGDPHSWPHPVRLVGRLLDAEEALARRLPESWHRVAGILLALCNAALSFAVVGLLVGMPLIGWLAGLYLAFSGLALGQLLREGRAVTGALDAGDIQDARRLLGGLVTRRTDEMDAPQMRRVLAETLSENLCDGLVAPFFYLALGGPALLWAYKTVSTMDSMWGYRTPRFIRLGYGCARLDDLLAFIPARMTALAILGAGWCMGLRPGNAWAKVREDAAKMSSPNAGWPMAAAAWVMGAAMGGAAVYFGETVAKPQLGPQHGVWTEEKSRRLEGLLAVAGVAACLVMLFCTAAVMRV